MTTKAIFGKAKVLAQTGLILAILRVRLSGVVYPEAKSFIIQPTVDMNVERLPSGDYSIRWLKKADRVQVYQDDKLLSEVTNGDHTTISGITEPHPIFILKFFGGDLDQQRIEVGSRNIPLEGGHNFRDLGGYQTSDGHRVRWGRVYRSGSLGHLTENDLNLLEKLGVKIVCDFRTQMELREEPDKLPPGVKYQHMPLSPENQLTPSASDIMKNLKNLDAWMLRTYINIFIDQNGMLFGEILRLAADEANLPLLFHCTAGKDRTGIAASLLLLALGVPESTVIADYSLTNFSFDALYTRLAEHMPNARLRSRLTYALQPLLFANPSTLTTALRHIDEKYGSVRNYLIQQAGITETHLERLHANLLHP